MRILDETRKIEIYNPDLEKGYLVEERIVTGHTEEIPAVQSRGRYEVEKEFPNGGRAMRWVEESPFVPAKPSEPIFEDVKVFIPFSAEEIKAKEEQKADERRAAEEERQSQIAQNFSEKHAAEFEEYGKALDFLTSTDHKTLQFLEGDITEYEFGPIKEKRRQARATVRRLRPILERPMGDTYA